MKLVYFGTPEFALAPLQALINDGHEVMAVVTQPDRKSGRGRKVSQCPVKVLAMEAGINVLQPQKVRDPDFVQVLKKINPEIIVVAAYGQILPPEIINLPKRGCVNIHASLLPHYRGAAPINWAIINGDKVTGITTMLMDEGMDTGPVLLKQETAISAEDTTSSLSMRLSAIGAELLAPTLEGLRSGNLKPEPQDGRATYAPILKKSDGLISWSKTAYELSRFINGMNPWPGAYTFLDGERIKIARALPEEGDGTAGKIVFVSKDKLYVGTGSGLISIIELQPSGKPVMEIKSFLQGRKLKEGQSFSSVE